jgi:hypothetical protein
MPLAASASGMPVLMRPTESMIMKRVLIAGLGPTIAALVSSAAVHFATPATASYERILVIAAGIQAAAFG